jgi:hypothetical protein
LLPIDDLGEDSSPIGNLQRMRRIAFALLLVGLTPARARGDGSPLVADVARASSGGDLTIDGGLFLALPTTLGPSLSTGFGAGVLRGGTFAWGARASWSTATESSMTWTVTQWDLRLRVDGAVQHRIGRARVGLRLGLGPTIVHETRDRNSGNIETTESALLPAGELEAFVALHIFGPWLCVLSGGPSAVVDSGALHAGWLSLIGVGWQP